MRLRLRFGWYAIVAIVFVLGFFGIFSVPKDSSSALKMLGAIESWWEIHAAYPAVAAFALGLMIGTALLPELWIQVKPHVFPLKPQADITAGDAFKLLFSRSKLARKLVEEGMLTRAVMYESHLTEAQKIAGRLRVELADYIHNALTDARIRAWGRLDGGRPEQEIVFSEWSDVEIDFSPRTLESSPSWVCAYNRGSDPRGRKIAYVGIRFCRKQLLQEFPLRRFNFGRVRYVSFGENFEEIQI
jgi:hypothetical protein